MLDPAKWLRRVRYPLPPIVRHHTHGVDRWTIRRRASLVCRRAGAPRLSPRPEPARSCGVSRHGGGARARRRRRHHHPGAARHESRSRCRAATRNENTTMKFLRRLLYLLRNRGMEAEFAEELETHRWMAQERELQGRAADAAAASRRAMGNVTLAREDARAQWIAPWLDSVWQDVAVCAADVPPCAGVHGRACARDGARHRRDDGSVHARRRPRAEGSAGEPAGSSRLLLRAFVLVPDLHGGEGAQH